MSDSTTTSSEYTVEDWLFGCVNFAVPQTAVDFILATRGVDGDTLYEDSGDLDVDIRLLKADLLKWIVLGAGKVNNTTDSDNGWSHSDGGYTLSKDDKKMLLAEANAIYEELEEDSVFYASKTTVHSLGIRPVRWNLNGTPIIPRYEE